MKVLLTALVSLPLFIIGNKHPATTRIIKDSPGFTCVLSADKTVYKKGGLPKLTVSIINKTGKDVYLVGSLDGSDLQWRMPWCYFSMSKPGPEPEMQMRCGNMNTLNEKDFRLVKAGASFNPYEQVGNYGFFSDYITGSAGNFKDAGIYKISFHYSSNSENINDFMGDRPSKYHPLDTAKIFPLFKQTAKIEVTSNEIEFRVE